MRRMKPHGPFPSFSLRSLLLFILAVGIGLAFVARLVREGERRAAAAALIQSHGGQIQYAHLTYPRSTPNPEPPGHPLLRRILGEHCFLRVYGVYGRLDEPSLAALEQFEELSHLDVCGERITNTGLRHIEGLSSLQFVSIQDARISGDGLASVGKVNELQCLWICDTPVRDQDLQGLAGLNKLWDLSIFNRDSDAVQIQGVGFRDCPDFGNLHSLNLIKTPICDAALEYIGRYPSLQNLKLVRTHVTGSGLRHLLAIPNLVVLTLSESPVNDDAVPYLKQMKTLGVLFVGGTSLSPQAIQELRKALPKTEIYEETHHSNYEPTTMLP